MKTLAQSPWVPYMVIPEEGDWYLSEDAPEEVKKKYDEWQKEIEEFTRKGLPYPK